MNHHSSYILTKTSYILTQRSNILKQKSDILTHVIHSDPNIMHETKHSPHTTNLLPPWDKGEQARLERHTQVVAVHGPVYGIPPPLLVAGN